MIASLSATIDGVDSDGLAGAAHQQAGQHEHDPGGRQVDEAARAIRRRAAARRRRQLQAEHRPSSDCARSPTSRPRPWRRHGVFEDEVPADDPGAELAERRVGVGVGAARRPGSSRRVRRSTGRRRRRRSPPRTKERHEAGAGIVRRRGAGEDEDAGADRRPEADARRARRPTGPSPAPAPGRRPARRRGRRWISSPRRGLWSWRGAVRTRGRGARLGQVPRQR